MTIPFVHRAPEEQDVLERIRELGNHLREGKPSCEVIDELQEVADLSVTHPNPDVRDAARRLQAVIGGRRTRRKR